MTIDSLEKSGNLIYKYIRGSHCHGIATEKSDIDYGGIFISPVNNIIGLRSNYIEQVSDAKSDIVYYEIGRALELLLKSNPTVLESVFVDPEFVVTGLEHPYIKYLRDNRDAFLSKDSFNNIIGYSISQIKKCRGLNKMIVNPIVERKDVLDFCYTFKEQGSEPVKSYLERNHLKQEFCGLVNIANMHDIYSVFYDWGNHFNSIKDCDKDVIIPFMNSFYRLTGYNNLYSIPKERIFENNYPPIGYRGIIGIDGQSNEVRLSSVEKGSLPIFYMSYNESGYQSHCRKYKEYKEWEKNRNPVRYESNLLQNYDAKNVAECVRLLHMGIELAQGKGFNVKRTWDREMLLDIRAHKYEYDEIIKYVEDKKLEMESAVKSSTLPDHINYSFVNDLLLKIRRDQFRI